MPKIVERYIWKVKWGHANEFFELTKAEVERFGPGEDHGIYRILTPRFGPMSTVVGEWVFDSEEQQQKAWAKWTAQPESREWMENVDKLIESATRELWTEH